MAYPAYLPLSYGPDSICLRIDNGNSVVMVPWGLMAMEISKRPTYTAITVHQLKNGNFGVSIDEDDMRVYTPREFITLCTDIGRRGDAPLN